LLTKIGYVGVLEDNIRFTLSEVHVKTVGFVNTSLEFLT
jgi:hypothetical protein